MRSRIVVLVLLLLALGCAPKGPDGEMRVDRDRCTAIVELLEPIVGLVCDADFIPMGDTPEEEEANRKRCEFGAELVALGSKLGCTFADDVAAQ